METSPRAGPIRSSDNLGWTLVKVFDVVAVVLSCVVTIRAIGGVLSALGVPSLNLNLGAPSGTGLTVNSADFSIPTWISLQYGTAWADLTSGLLLLTAVGLLAVPRLVWEVPPEERWAVAAPKLIVGVLVIAAASTIAAVVGTVNMIWNSGNISPSNEALEVAGNVGAAILCTLTSVLAWFAVRLTRSVGASPDEDELTELA